MNDEIVVFFDGHCVLCNSSVQWLLKRDKKQVFKFASLQGAYAQKLNIQPRLGQMPDSIVLLENGETFERSEALLRIVKQLGLPWKLARVFIIFPAKWRDIAYNFIGRNRYRWFGKHEHCLMPDPAWKSRFID